MGDANGFADNIGANGFAGNIGANGVADNIGANGFADNNGANGVADNIGANGFAGNIGANGVADNIGANGFADNNGANGFAHNIGANGFAHIGDYSYCSFYHTTGFVFFNANTNHAELFNLYPQHHDLPSLTHLDLPAFIPTPFTILSASWGFILFRDALESYHIFGPLSDPLYGHTRLPDPPRPHTNNTPAVLAPNIPSGKYHAVCAVHEGDGNYTFDTYSSATRVWSQAQGLIDLHGHSIIMNTGVSCNGHAYWLTDGLMPVVVRHDPESHSSMILEGDGALSNIVGPERRGLQLGRVRTHLAIVVLKADWVADLHVLVEGTHWVPSLSDMIMEAGQNDDHVQVVPLRFESHKMEVLFCVGHERRLLLWQSSNEINTTRVEWLEGSGNIWDHGASEADIVNGVPYLLPFVLGFQQFPW